jgi:hypothetical protein
MDLKFLLSFVWIRDFNSFWKSSRNGNLLMIIAHWNRNERIPSFELPIIIIIDYKIDIHLPTFSTFLLHCSFHCIYQYSWMQCNNNAREAEDWVFSKSKIIFLTNSNLSSLSVLIISINIQSDCSSHFILVEFIWLSSIFCLLLEIHCKLCCHYEYRSNSLLFLFKFIGSCLSWNKSWCSIFFFPIKIHLNDRFVIMENPWHEFSTIVKNNDLIPDLSSSERWKWSSK